MKNKGIELFRSGLWKATHSLWNSDKWRETTEGRKSSVGTS